MYCTFWNESFDWLQNNLWAQTHPNNIKELAVTKADCHVASHRLCLLQKAALEDTTKTRADGQLVGRITTDKGC